MTTKELHNSIIQKISHSDNYHLLNYLNQLLSEGREDKICKLTDFEKSSMSERLADYEFRNITSNKDIISRNKKWFKY
jgi:hypothetical protein